MWRNDYKNGEALMVEEKELGTIKKKQLFSFHKGKENGLDSK